MSAGMRSRAITAHAPAASAIRACSGVVTSMITPPLSICANWRLRAVLSSIFGICFDRGMVILLFFFAAVHFSSCRRPRSPCPRKALLPPSAAYRLPQHLGCHTKSAANIGKKSEGSKFLPLKNGGGLFHTLSFSIPDVENGIFLTFRKKLWFAVWMRRARHQARHAHASTPRRPTRTRELRTSLPPRARICSAACVRARRIHGR